MFLKHVSFPYKTIYMLTSIFNVLEVSFGTLNDTLSGIRYDTFAETQRTQSLDSNMDTQTWIHTENSNQHVNTQNEISPQCRSNSNQRNKMTKMRAGQIKASNPSNNILLN